MKRSVLILFIIVLSANEMAGKGRLHERITFGVEWGYIGVFYTGHHYNFFDSEGYRFDVRENEFRYDTNAEGYLHVGYDVTDTFNISLYAGFSAIEDYHLTVPFSFRMTRFYGNDPEKDRWFAFVDLGSGFSLKKKPQEIFTGKIGAGYRVSLSMNTKLDFNIALRSAYTRPDIEFYGESISHENINRNNAYVSAISLGMAITF